MAHGFRPEPVRFLMTHKCSYVPSARLGRAGRAAVPAYLLVALLTMAGCAGSGGPANNAASGGFRQSAPVEVIRVLDREFVRNSSTATTSPVSLQNPIAMAVSANGDLMIADKGNGQIIRTDAQGNLLASAAYFDPRGLSTTRAPRFVRMDYNGNVYITDAVNAQVVIYDSRLRPVSTMVPPYAALNLSEGAISGIALGSYGEFYAVDMFNGRIFRFDASGRYLATIPSPDEATAPLNHPVGIACSDHDGSVYVCEAGNAQIVVFDNLGTVLRTFGGSDLKDPVAIALDKQGRCYVADDKLDAIMIFNRDGRYIDRLDAGRIGFADFGAPTDVTISDASLYIADPTHGRILQIRFGAGTPRP